jgi:hypothetical protein
VTISEKCTEKLVEEVLFFPSPKSLKPLATSLCGLKLLVTISEKCTENLVEEVLPL